MNIDIKESDIIRPYSINSPAFENVLALNDETDYAMMTRWATKLAEKISDSDRMARLTSRISEKLPKNAPADVSMVMKIKINQFFNDLSNFFIPMAYVHKK